MYTAKFVVNDLTKSVSVTLVQRESRPVVHQGQLHKGNIYFFINKFICL